MSGRTWSMARILAFAFCLTALSGCTVAGFDRDSTNETPQHADDGHAVTALAKLPQGWTQLAWPPVNRASSAAVWAGTGLFVWGGDTQSDTTHHADGAFWDPVANRWSVVPDAPIPGRSQAAAVWTGREVLVWGGTSSQAHGDGAAFDPRARAWRELPYAPLSARVPLAGVWTGAEFIVWGDQDRREKVRDGAAYDPATDTWREIAPAPEALNQGAAVWTGSELIIVGAWLDGNNRGSTPTARALTYDPVADTWQTLPPPPLSPQASTVARVGNGDALAWDYELAAATWRSDAPDWHEEPGLPLDFSECYPSSARVGRVVVGWYCGLGATFDPQRRTWTRIPRRSGFSAGPIAAGPVALFVGPGLFAYRPL
jgi:hypothetical protein